MNVDFYYTSIEERALIILKVQFNLTQFLKF